MSKEFNFSGLPGNEPFEVQGKKPKIQIPNNQDPDNFMTGFLNGMDAETLKGMLPKHLLDEFAEGAQQMGMELDDLLTQGISDAIMIMTGKKALPEEDEETEENMIVYELSDIQWLGKQPLGDIPGSLVGSYRLSERFIQLFGEHGEKYNDVIESLLTSDLLYVNEIGLSALMHMKGNLSEIKIKEVNDKFILAYMEPSNKDEYGFYFVYSQDDEGTDCISVPLFANTFKVSEEGEFLGLFSKTNEAPFFDGDRFVPEKRAALDLSIRSCLVDIKNILLSPAQFGTLKNVIPAVTGDSRFLQVGTLISNESTEAILLKKDADLDLNQKEFPFYLDFGRPVTKDSLQILASVLFKIDLNDTILLQASELEFKNGMLFIRVDFGEHFE